MRYPTLPTQASSREMIDLFRGYNHNHRIDKDQFYDMKNLTSDSYPLLAPRKPRGFYTGGTAIRAMVAKDELCYVDDSDFVIGSNHIGMGLTAGEKTLVSMGAYVIILPDKRYINTVNPADRGKIEASKTTDDSVTFALCRVTGEPYDVTHIGTEAPENPENKALWMDTSTTPNSLKQYAASSDQWVGIASTYIRITSTDIGKAFEVGDGVRITGLKGVDLLDAETGDPIVDEDIAAIDGDFVIQDKGDNYIVIIGLLTNFRTLSNPVTIKRSMPELDFVIEAGNRLWGCRYGQNADGEFVNEIYASKLGDFKNWNVFSGVSTDSYRASLGSDGAFTGAINHLGYPLFFKAEWLHKVYGSYPAQYQIQDTACRGVQVGSHKSLAIVNEILYYKSRLGVCAYDGSLPIEISSALGDVSYTAAVAGAHGNKYFISMRDVYGTYHLFVYDASKGMWHKEDNTQVLDFCSYGNDMYFIDAADGFIKSVYGLGGAAEKTAVDWMYETGLLGVDDPDKKYISRLQIRMQLDTNSVAFIYIEYDSSGKWEYVCNIRGTSLKSYNLPIKPKRCDHMRLKVEGRGDFKLFSITKTIEQGSDL